MPPRPQKRRRWLRVVIVLAFVAAPFALFGYTSVVTPPAAVNDPISVFLLHDQLHVGVVLPDRASSPQRYVEFGFGDWGYYAAGNDSWYHTFATVLWPTAGALSRREFAAADPTRLRAVAHWVELEELVVERAAANALRERLEKTFAASQDRKVRRDAFAMDFVPADDGYWFLFTCADVVADWLTELGCSVSWVPIRVGVRAAH